MCGIVGYIGKKKAVPILINGLKRLEYRGYDSAGIATLTGGNIVVEKQAGKISELEKVVCSRPVKDTIGIGHTRWATHGEPTKVNAHPHCDCTKKITIIHNGIIENYLTLKRDLEKKGHEFGMQQLKDYIESQGIADKLNVSVGDSLYGSNECRKIAVSQENQIHIFRLRSDRNVFCEPDNQQNPSDKGRVQEYGNKMQLNNPALQSH